MIARTNQAKRSSNFTTIVSRILLRNIQGKKRNKTSSYYLLYDYRNNVCISEGCPLLEFANTKPDIYSTI